MTRASRTIASSTPVFHPGVYSQARNGDVIRVDGLKRGIRWNRQTALADELGITGPVGAPTMATSSSGGFSYVTGYRFIDRNRVQPSSLSAVRAITGSAVTGITYTWSDFNSSAQARVEYVEAYRSTDGQTTAVYPIYLTGYAITPHATPATTITNSGGYVKVTTAAAAAHGYKVGDYVVLAGFTPTHYNTIHLVTSVPSADTFITNVGYSGPCTVVGTVTQRVYQFGDAGTWASETNGVGANAHVFTYSGNQALAVGMKITIAGHTVGAMNIEHRITAITKTTFTTSNTTDVADDVDGGTWTLTGIQEALADTDLTTAVLTGLPALPILNPDGSPNARRFEVPPTHMGAVAFFQDRAWYGVAVSYNEGTITLSNSSQTVTGSGTSWTSDMVGRYLYCTTESAPLLITAYASATSITVEKNPTGNTSGLAYSIAPHPNERRKIYFSEPDEPESVPPINVIIIQDNTGDSDAITGMMPHGTYLYVFTERHTYRISFARQPLIDGNTSLAWSRGCVNRRAWCTWADMAFVMDQEGIYAVPLFGGGGVENISEPIQNLFRDGTIHWTHAKWFHAVTDHENWQARFYVVYASSGSGVPRRCLTYNIATQTWDPESYVQSLGGVCIVEMSGKPALIAAGEDDYCWKLNAGFGDGVSPSVEGTADASSTTTNLVASSSVFVSTHLFATVAVTAGTNKGLVRRITAYGSSTSITTDAFPVAHDATTQFLVGGIPWNLKTHDLDYPDGTLDTKASKANLRGVRVNYSPTTNNATLDVRYYLNQATTPASGFHAANMGDGVTRENASTDAVVNLKATRSVLANSKGTALVGISGGRNDGSGESDQSVSIELRGVGGIETIEANSLTLYGVEE